MQLSILMEHTNSFILQLNDLTMADYMGLSVLVLLPIGYFLYKLPSTSIKPNIIGGFLMLISLILLLCCAQVKENEKRNNIDNALQQNYTVYIDGKEVDIKSIDLQSYDNIKFDNENKYVIITTD